MARANHGDASEFAQVALCQGVMIVPGPQFSAHEGTEGQQDRLRIPFVLSEDALEEGVRRLARAWAIYEPGRTTYACMPEAIV